MEFAKPDGYAPSPHLFVANCGPAVDVHLPSIARVFSAFGHVVHLQLADTTGCRVIVSFHDIAHAKAAQAALHGLPCPELANRVLHIQYSVARRAPMVKSPLRVFEAASEMGVPGLYLFENFVGEDLEQELLAAVDGRPWQALSKRRVQHYGYEFQYKIRNVDIMENMGKLPEFTDGIVEKISMLSELTDADEVSLPLDQLTVNEYPPGVGLSPHIDTHSAFEGAIVSLSLAGPCVMEFRQYTSDGDGSMLEKRGGCQENAFSEDKGFENKDPHAKGQDEAVIQRSPVQTRSIFLSERSLLVLLGEARYWWHHYIPHRKIDVVNGHRINRKQRRVSFTFRKVRRGPCHCKFESVCDSQCS